MMGSLIRSTTSRAFSLWVCASFAVSLPGVSWARDAAEVKARALFAAAQKDYDLGQFEDALKGYSEAYRTKELAGFLFKGAMPWTQALLVLGATICAVSVLALVVRFSEGEEESARAEIEARLALAGAMGD